MNTSAAYTTPEKLTKPYNPTDEESRIYDIWEKSGYFTPENMIKDGYTKADATPFTIVLPPPNVTGSLHMGHAMMLTVQDILIRYKRMSGYRTLWLPGTDHAAIATQSKVEKEIQKTEGKSRHDLGREEMLRRIGIFAQNSHDTIVSQMKVMGASCDWTREAFTLDAKRNLAVNTIFKKMYDDGLIYRGHRIVNWDPKGQTTISDDEIVYEARKATMYTFKYSHDFPIAISTTRPETKVGDVAVAVHPSDERYTQYVGQEYDAVFCGVPIHIKIIADESVEKDFGTGALGVTPAHSMTDWEIADRHDLPRPQVINEYAKMTVGDERLMGKKVLEAREAIVSWLREENLITEEKEIDQNVSTAERTGGIIEPLPKLQWFINVNKPIADRDGKTLKELMQEAVGARENQIQIIPEYLEKVYRHWIDNLHDWCISRQIWYGHRIPVWYKRQLGGPNQAKHFNFEVLLLKLKMTEVEFNTLPIPDHAKTAGSENIQIGSELMIYFKDKNLIDEDWIKSNEITQKVYLDGELYCGVTAPSEEGWVQDEDTLDTWFSSGIWTFSTLGWPENTEDFKIYHPTSVLETGYDILPFWVSRMILMTTYALGTIPFKTVYFNGLVRTEKGEKMSKSLGNAAMDPLDIAKEFGTDAGRMALIVGSTPGIDTKISKDKIKGYKLFANKIWNIARFILSNTGALDLTAPYTAQDTARYDAWREILADITKDLDSFKFHTASEAIYHYMWDTLASEIIEESKPILAGTDTAAKASREKLLYTLLSESIKTLHPFMPFVTEAIWEVLPEKETPLLMVAPWPAQS